MFVRSIRPQLPSEPSPPLPRARRFSSLKPPSLYCMYYLRQYGVLRINRYWIVTIFDVYVLLAPVGYPNRRQPCILIVQGSTLMVSMNWNTSRHQEDLDETHNKRAVRCTGHYGGLVLVLAHGPPQGPQRR